MNILWTTQFYIIDQQKCGTGKTMLHLSYVILIMLKVGYHTESRCQHQGGVQDFGKGGSG